MEKPKVLVAVLLRNNTTKDECRRQDSLVPAPVAGVASATGAEANLGVFFSRFTWGFLLVKFANRMRQNKIRRK